MMFELPVSLGEAFDKLTILDIKIENIKNLSKLEDCKQEQKVLYEKLSTIVQTYTFWYKALKAVNAEIWRLQDILRATTEDSKDELSRYVLDLNDARFRIKNRINTWASSTLKEQKGYNDRILVLTEPITLHDAFTYRNILYYLSIEYDVVYCVSNEMKFETLFQSNIHLVDSNTLDMYKPNARVYSKPLHFTIIKDLHLSQQVVDQLVSSLLLVIDKNNSDEDYLKSIANAFGKQNDEVIIMSSKELAIQETYKQKIWNVSLLPEDIYHKFLQDEFPNVKRFVIYKPSPDEKAI